MKTLTVTLHHFIMCRTFTTLPRREESVLLDIQPEELHSKMQDQNFLNEAQLIDVREPEEVYVPIPLLLYLCTPLFHGFTVVLQNPFWLPRFVKDGERKILMPYR